MEKNKNNIRSFWLSSNKMTVGVDTDKKGIIIKGAPITRKFKGQHIKDLVKWMKKQRGFKAKEIKLGVSPHST